MLITAVQQSGSVIHTYTFFSYIYSFPLWFIRRPFKLQARFLFAGLDHSLGHLSCSQHLPLFWWHPEGRPPHCCQVRIEFPQGRASPDKILTVPWGGCFSRTPNQSTLYLHSCLHLATVPMSWEEGWEQTPVKMSLSFTILPKFSGFSWLDNLQFIPWLWLITPVLNGWFYCLANP